MTFGASKKTSVLDRKGVHLENGRRLKVVALDKTGTVTEGKPKLTDVFPMTDRSREDVLQIAASIDALSSHPIAQAIATASTLPLLPAEEFNSLIGRGVTGRIAGQSYPSLSTRLMTTG